MKYKAIIFDLDGTVIDTEHIWRDVTHELVTKRGIAITPEISSELHQIMAGVGLLEGAKHLKRMFNLEDTIEQIAHEKSTRVLNKLKTELIFMDGFLEFYKKTQNHGLKTGLATNADEHTLLLVQEHLKIEQFFGKHMYSVAHVGKYKPDPAVYLHAIEKLGLKPHECIAIEDSAHGVRAAVAAGMYCIGLNSGKRAELVQEAHCIVNHYNEIELEKILEIPILKPI